MAVADSQLVEKIIRDRPTMPGRDRVIFNHDKRPSRIARELCSHRIHRIRLIPSSNVETHERLLTIVDVPVKTCGIRVVFAARWSVESEASGIESVAGR